jgi:hypothetical protein
MKLVRVGLGLGLATLVTGTLGCGGDESLAPAPTKHHVAGDAIPFDNGPDGRIEGAKISVLEHPEMTMTTGADGHFEFGGFDAGSEVTLVMEHPDYHLIQTGTLTLGDADIDRVTFQAVTHDIYGLLAGVVGVTPDETGSCQMVTTITRIGKSIYDMGAHGELGVTVTIDPPLPAALGPVYFNAAVIPDRDLKQSSPDGGVLYANVPPGEYTWTGTKASAEFTTVKMKCRPGVLVNASPPHGLQRTR